jgi:hypothetical protein
MDAVWELLCKRYPLLSKEIKFYSIQWMQCGISFQKISFANNIFLKLSVNVIQKNIPFRDFYIYKMYIVRSKNL